MPEAIRYRQLVVEMTSNLQKMWMTGFAFVVALSAAEARNVRQTNGWIPYNHEQYQRFVEDVGEVYDAEKIARPVSYSYFSSRDHSSTVFPAAQTRVATKNMPPGPEISYNNSYRPQEGSSSILSQKTVRFPLNTVLPGNSINFDNYPYPELLEAVNTFSDLTPARKPEEQFLVTHKTVSLPESEDGITAVSSRTRITNGEKGNYPYREFTETTHNAKGQRERVVEREQHLRVHHGFNEGPFPDIGKSEDAESKDDEDV